MTTAKDAVPPLRGVRVLDFGGQIAGPLVGMLLADQGADVIKVVRPARVGSTRPIDAVLDRGKRCIEVDLNDPLDRSMIAALVKDANIVIENFSPRVRKKLMLQAEDIHRQNADAIVVSLPGISEQDTLLEDAQAFEGLIAAATAQYTNIHAARQILGLDPVYTALPLASIYAGVHGATAAVIALQNHLSSAGGRVIEVPLANAAVSAMSSLHMRVERQPSRYDAPRLPRVVKAIALPLMRGWARRGGPEVQAKLLDITRKAYPALMTSYPCADGRLLYLFAIDNGKIVRAALQALGLLDGLLAEGLIFENPFHSGDRRNNLSESSNLSSKWQARLKESIREVLLTRPAADWETRLNDAGVPCAVQRTTKDWLALPELRAAGIVADIDDPILGLSSQPGPQIAVSSEGGSTAPPQPRRMVERHGNVGWLPRADPTRSTAGPRSEPCAPGDWLRDLTVVDMSSMVAGPVAGRTFAEYGARVIKVETPSPNHGPRLTCWYGIDGNQGKESILLDLKTTDGREAMHRLVAGADVLLTNHSAAAMAAFGLGDDDLRRLKPKLVRCRIGAYNGLHVGPWDRRPGYDPVLQAASGIMTRYGDPGFPELHAIASCVDALTGYLAAFGTAVALYALQNSSVGGGIDASLAAAATLVQLPYAFDHVGRVWDEPTGQLAKGENALNRLYRARDGWLFLAAPGSPWERLPRSLRPETFLTDAALAAHLESKISCQPTAQVIDMLSECGLSAARVQTTASLSKSLMKASGLRLVRQTIPHLGTVVVAPGQQVSSDGGLKSLSPAEKPGASTEQILRELGLDTEALLSSGAAKREITHDYLPA